MGTPGTIHQEMTRIMTRMRGQGVKYAWLSEDNLKAMQNRPGLFLAATQHPVPIEQMPSQMVPLQATQSSASQPPTAIPRQQFSAPTQPQVQSPVAKPTPPTIDAKTLADFSSAAKNADWPALETLARACTLCGLAATCKHKFFYTGAPKVRVLFIGDFPTFEEDESGIPFSGQAGQMLFNMGKAMGLNWSFDAQPQLAAGYLNVLKCRPTALPSDMQLSACLPLLQRHQGLQSVCWNPLSA